MHRREVTLLILMVTSMLLTGCGSSKNSGTVGGGKNEVVDMSVKFADTALDLYTPMLAVGDVVLYAPEGYVQVELETNRQYQYAINNLLGSHQGSFTYQGDGQVRLSFPAFAGWRESDFNTILLGKGKRGYTTRWDRGDVIAVWVEPVSSDPLVRQSYVDLAWEMLHEWSGLLSGVITFAPASSADAADLTISFDDLNPGGTTGYAGVCTRSWSPYTGRLAYGEIQIAYQAGGIKPVEWPSVYRHEIGHCIGLDHSDDSSHLMYPTVFSPYAEPSQAELGLTRLLYSIPLRTEGLTAASSFSGMRLRDYGGTLVTETIY